ncbi:MAG: type II secretion system protein [Candidatus Shapirobacteria bacterium]|nr:type II secretion system protein [Candidatus Shapirobacteria bacterium]
MNKKYGFTLIELLVVIGIIAALTTVVFVALDPVKRFKDARNARRITDTNTILGAIHQYIVDTGGLMPVGIGLSGSQIGSCVTGGNTSCPGVSTACIDLAATLSSNKYLKTNPIDPQGSVDTTGYSVSKDANNLFTVTACLAEGSTISVSR